ncbi:hypothetical protein V2J09_005767 [Rumex salicifolius]
MYKLPHLTSPFFSCLEPKKTPEEEGGTKESTRQMALQWMILTYVVAAETALALLLTIPTPKILRSRLVSLVSLILQPCMFILPFAAFQLLDIYWKNEHRLVCTSDICTATERDRFEKTLYKSQRNVVLCVAACLLCVYRICKYNKEIKNLEEVEKRYKKL